MKKTLILVVAAMILSAGAAYFAVKLTSKPATVAVAARATMTPAPESPDPGMIFPVAERVLNLTPSGAVPHYIRLELAIAFARPAGTKSPVLTPADKKATTPPLEPGLAPVTAHKVQIDDAVVRVVSSKTMEALNSTDGREAMKRDLLAAVREIVATPLAQGVYIVDMVLQ